MSRSVRVFALLFAVCASGPPLAGQSPAPAAAPTKSVRGTLLSVDKRLNGVFMKGDGDNKKMAWRMTPAVVEEVAKVPAGAPMIVIYRQTAANEKRITAVAFPGTAQTPIYVNLTGWRIVLRSGAAVDGACTAATEGPFTEVMVAPGDRAEVLGGCWCCAPADGTCTPSTRTGQGRALLERCFE